MAVNYINLADIDRSLQQAQLGDMQIQNAQLAQQDRRSQIERQARADQQQMQLRDIYAKSGGDLNKARNELYNQGFYEQGGQIDKQMGEQSKQKADIDKTTLETNAKRIGLIGNGMKFLIDNPSKQNALMTFNQLRNVGVIDQNQYDEFTGQLPDDPAMIKQGAEVLFRGALDAKDQLAKFETRDAGGTVETQQIDPVTGQIKTIGTIKKTQSPDSIASGEIQIRGQNMTNQRAREANDLKSQENEIKRGEKVPENSTDIRKEFEQLPEVKNYKQALPAYKGIEDAVNRNTPASDINIVYGIAKLYDPNSVVREGEYATVANSPNIPEKIKGYASYLSNGGKLSPAVKAQILREAQSRMSGYETEYKGQRDNYTSIAERSNADPTLIFPSEFKSAIKPTATTVKAPPLKTVKSDKDYNSLPKGARFKAPDGSIRVKQ